MAFGRLRITNTQEDKLAYLIELKTGTQDPSTFISKTAVDFLSDVSGQASACMLRLQNGLALRANMNASELVSMLGPVCTMFPLSSGYVNLAAIVAITPRNAATMLRLRGGSALAISPDVIPSLDRALLASVAGTALTVAA